MPEEDLTIDVGMVPKLVTPGPGEPTTAAHFHDIFGHLAEANIKQAVSIRFVNCYINGTFKPNVTVTRAEFTVMLMNALKLAGKGEELGFTNSILAWAQESMELQHYHQALRMIEKFLRGQEVK